MITHVKYSGSFHFWNPTFRGTAQIIRLIIVASYDAGYEKTLLKDSAQISIPYHTASFGRCLVSREHFFGLSEFENGTGYICRLVLIVVNTDEYGRALPYKSERNFILYHTGYCGSSLIIVVSYDAGYENALFKTWNKFVLLHSKAH